MRGQALWMGRTVKPMNLLDFHRILVLVLVS